MKQSVRVRCSNKSLALNHEFAAPLLNTWQPAYLALARRARLDGVRTILTGEGGDEWLTVTPYLSADLIRRGALVELAQFFGTLLRSYSVAPACDWLIMHFGVAACARSPG